MIDRLVERRPNVVAIGAYAIVATLAYWPLWMGRVLLNGDQHGGYPFRAFAAEFIKKYGEAPGWIPHEFGGMPYLANTAHGDTFFPTALLRLIMPVDVGMAFGLFAFTLLAGVFMYLFLRGLRISWGGAFIGGGAYMLTGQLISLTNAGHDGKLFVSALMPLALLFLYRAVTRNDVWQYLFFGVVVGFTLLSPHFQMTYYLLMAAGFFWLFLIVWSGERAATSLWWKSGLLFGGAILLGVLVSAIQIAPFAEYFGYSPRGASGGVSTGYPYATGWSMPPEELFNIVWPAFSGMLENYWGRNQFKTHSEYVGVSVILLATMAFARTERRRLAWFFVFLASYGVLFAFGGHTPFYRLPYHLLPFLKSTRVPSMIFFLTAFSLCTLAAMGFEALVSSRATPSPEREQGKKNARRARQESVVTESVSAQLAGVPRPLAWALIAVVVISILGMLGAWRGLMQTLAASTGFPHKINNVATNYPLFIADTVRVLFFAALVWVLCRARGRIGNTGEMLGLALCGVVLLDLYSVERRYLNFTPRAEELYAPDAVTNALRADTSMFRVLPVSDSFIGDNYLVQQRVGPVVSYNGQEIHRYDELWGGKNSWLGGASNFGNPAIWRLAAVKYVVIYSQFTLPELEPVGGALRTHRGGDVFLYRYKGALPFSFLVPHAFRTDVADSVIVGALSSDRFDPQAVIIVPKDSPVGGDSLPAVASHMDTPVAISRPRPDQLRAELSAAAPADAFLYISENWYPGWRATVDGADAPVVRAQLTFMAVPVKAGARVVELRFVPDRYYLGRNVTIATVLLVLIAAIAGRVMRRKSANAPVAA